MLCLADANSFQRPPRCEARTEELLRGSVSRPVLLAPVARGRPAMLTLIREDDLEAARRIRAAYEGIAGRPLRWAPSDLYSR